MCSLPLLLVKRHIFEIYELAKIYANGFSLYIKLQFFSRNSNKCSKTIDHWKVGNDLGIVKGRWKSHFCSGWKIQPWKYFRCAFVCAVFVHWIFERVKEYVSKTLSRSKNSMGRKSGIWILQCVSIYHRHLIPVLHTWSLSFLRFWIKMKRRNFSKKNTIFTLNYAYFNNRIEWKFFNPNPNQKVQTKLNFCIGYYSLEICILIKCKKGHIIFTPVSRIHGEWINKLRKIDKNFRGVSQTSLIRVKLTQLKWFMVCV